VAIDGAAAGATYAAVTGTAGTEAGASAGAVATAGTEAGASAGAVATAGAEAGASAGAVATAGADGGAPGTPPVTLIESPLESSLLAGWGTDAAGGAEFAGSLRIESPTVPEPPAGDDIGVLTPS
jgi:hypothetical protein